MWGLTKLNPAKYHHRYKNHTQKWLCNSICARKHSQGLQNWGEKKHVSKSTLHALLIRVCWPLECKSQENTPLMWCRVWWGSRSTEWTSYRRSRVAPTWCILNNYIWLVCIKQGTDYRRKGSNQSHNRSVDLIIRVLSLHVLPKIITVGRKFL